MMKYKCNDCGHQWSSPEQPDQCPAENCGSDNFQEVNGGFIEWIKKRWWIIVLLLAFILLLRMCSGCSNNKTTVDVDYDKDMQKLEVKLTGSQTDEYRITVKREGNTFKHWDKKENVTGIFDIPGNYNIEVKYIGSGKVPELSWNGIKSFTVDEKPLQQAAPQITKIESHADFTKVAVSVTADIPSEYSCDGNTWQAANQFNNLKPQTMYTFYARNANDKALISAPNVYTTPPLKTKAPSPSDAVLNQLLKDMATGDHSAFKRWRSQVEEGNSIPVSGISNISNSYELAQDAMAGNKYTVSTERDNDKKITEIHVK